jgi:hypothetical protein
MPAAPKPGVMPTGTVVPVTAGEVLPELQHMPRVHDQHKRIVGSFTVPYEMIMLHKHV